MILILDHFPRFPLIPSRRQNPFLYIRLWDRFPAGQVVSIGREKRIGIFGFFEEIEVFHDLQSMLRGDIRWNHPTMSEPTTRRTHIAPLVFLHLNHPPAGDSSTTSPSIAPAAHETFLSPFLSRRRRAIDNPPPWSKMGVWACHLSVASQVIIHCLEWLLLE
jgi:hypothetical protein